MAGYAHTRVVPVLVESGNLEAEPDPATLARLDDAKQSGGADWIFVGQLAPHKAQHDVIKAFACYRKAYDQNARLHLVGREMGDTYRDALRRFIADIGLNGAVELAGSVSTAQLAAYYASADVFVCCSDHEGFCVPVVEAMHRGVPVVAYAVAALPETIGAGGLLLASKAPGLVAAAVHELMKDPETRGAMIAAGTAQARRYTLSAARTAFRGSIEEALTLA
jgi:glycosyltransferase involved in cell wall biosynthesis